MLFPGLSFTTPRDNILRPQTSQDVCEQHFVVKTDVLHLPSGPRLFELEVLSLVPCMPMGLRIAAKSYEEIFSPAGKGNFDHKPGQSEGFFDAPITLSALSEENESGPSHAAFLRITGNRSGGGGRRREWLRGRFCG